jgi:hypothetical protein
LGQADSTEVDELVKFAFDCWPQADRLGVYRTLQLRRRMGPRLAPHFKPFVSTFTVARRANSWLRYRVSAYEPPSRALLEMDALVRQLLTDLRRLRIQASEE